MKILQVITGMRKAAGTTTFVENLVVGLRKSGHEVDIAMSADKLESCDVMHIHGLWSGFLHNACQYAKARNIPIAWSTHGMTAPWSLKHKWWKKLPAWWLYQKSDLNQAKFIHCTTELESKWNRKLGFGNCLVVPLGTNFRSSGEAKRRFKVLLFVGRIYPVKAIDRLIRAFALVPTEVRQGWHLRIVGPDQAGHQHDLEQLVQELRICDSVEFAGPKFEDELSAEYANCDCLALVSHTENFGATVVDAMAYGRPVIAGNKTPWREVSERKCGWWVSNEPQVLAGAISEMIEAGEERRREMGARGRKLVEEKYTWDAVTKAMVEGYEEVLNARA